jgi:hypothetical protein
MNRLLLTRNLVDALVAEIGAWGDRHAETGGFLLAAEDNADRATVLALGGQSGIVRRRNLFAISGGAIERLFSWAGDTELRIRAQVHSHAHGAFLSRTDLQHGFDVDGFITAVVPHFAAPSAHPGDWGWWQRGGGCWQAQRSPDVVAGSVHIVRFDEGGVRAT